MYMYILHVQLRIQLILKSIIHVHCTCSNTWKMSFRFTHGCLLLLLYKYLVHVRVNHLVISILYSHSPIYLHLIFKLHPVLNHMTTKRHQFLRQKESPSQPRLNVTQPHRALAARRRSQQVRTELRRLCQPSQWRSADRKPCTHRHVVWSTSRHLRRCPAKRSSPRCNHYTSTFARALLCTEHHWKHNKRMKHNHESRSGWWNTEVCMSDFWRTL